MSTIYLITCRIFLLNAKSLPIIKLQIVNIYYARTFSKNKENHLQLQGTTKKHLHNTVIYTKEFIKVQNVHPAFFFMLYHPIFNLQLLRNIAQYYCIPLRNNFTVLQFLLHNRTVCNFFSLQVDCVVKKNLKFT